VADPKLSDMDTVGDGVGGGVTVTVNDSEAERKVRVSSSLIVLVTVTVPVWPPQLAVAVVEADRVTTCPKVRVIVSDPLDVTSEDPVLDFVYRCGDIVMVDCSVMVIMLSLIVFSSERANVAFIDPVIVASLECETECEKVGLSETVLVEESDTLSEPLCSQEIESVKVLLANPTVSLSVRERDTVSDMESENVLVFEN